MTKALIDRIKIGCFGLDPIDPLRLLLDEVIEALAQPAPYIAVSNDRMSVDPHTGNVSIGTAKENT